MTRTAVAVEARETREMRAMVNFMVALLWLLFGDGKLGRVRGRYRERKKAGAYGFGFGGWEVRVKDL